MKSPGVVVLVLSLAANVALVLGAWRTPVQRQAVASATEGGAPVRDSAPDAAPERTGPAGAGVVPAGGAAGLGSPDPAVVRDALRAAGVPEVYVRAVVWRRIRATHHAEIEAIVRARGESHYWEPADRAADAAMRAAANELDRAMREEFKQFFGEAYGEVARARRARERLAFLPGDKAEEVTRISEDYAELTRKIRDDMVSGVVLDEDQQKLAMLEDERTADLARVLTPGELDLFELHTSRTAETMRSRLGYFEPTEQEFRAIFALQSAYDREYGSSFGASSREAMQARAVAQRELGEQIARALGPDRYADYQRATNTSYQAAVKIADHFGRPRESAGSVHALEQEYRQRARVAMSAGDRSQAAVLAQTMAAEAWDRVVALLGEEGAKAYRETGGSWLRSMEQQAGRAAPAP
ncbi:MAG: hypothetical protein IAE82_11435 [Opitutaceae bacterium]|nr:hypothetical protein [Opitutaceae bacterium]